MCAEKLTGTEPLIIKSSEATPLNLEVTCLNEDTLNDKGDAELVITQGKPVSESGPSDVTSHPGERIKDGNNDVMKSPDVSTQFGT